MIIRILSKKNLLLTSAQILDLLKPEYLAKFNSEPNFQTVNSCLRNTYFIKTISEKLSKKVTYLWSLDPGYEFTFEDNLSLHQVVFPSNNDANQAKLATIPIVQAAIVSPPKRRVYKNVLERDDLVLHIPQANEMFHMSPKMLKWWNDPNSYPEFSFFNDSDFDF